MPQIRPLSRLKTVVARSMHQARQETAHATLHAACDVTALMAAPPPEAERVSVAAQALYALTQTLRDFPTLNAHIATDELCVYESIKLGLMVNTPRGVQVGCISEAGRYTRPALAAAVTDLHARAWAGGLHVAETRGATFMAVDLSSFPVDAFTPILVPSALAMLGIGRVRAVCHPGPAGCHPAHELSLSLTFDHRGTDEFVASRFLAALVACLEQA